MARVDEGAHRRLWQKLHAPTENIEEFDCCDILSKNCGTGTTAPMLCKQGFCILCKNKKPCWSLELAGAGGLGRPCGKLLAQIVYVYG